jgi:hypothetical protein
LYCFWTQLSLVADSFLSAWFICPHFVTLDRDNF